MGKGKGKGKKNKKVGRRKGLRIIIDRRGEREREKERKDQLIKHFWIECMYVRHAKVDKYCTSAKFDQIPWNLLEASKNQAS